jgi:hypothetical protein
MKWPKSFRPKVDPDIAREMDRAARAYVDWLESIRAKNGPENRVEKLMNLLRRVFVAGGMFENHKRAKDESTPLSAAFTVEFDDGSKIVVNPMRGSDKNKGTENSPLRTFKAALRRAGLGR